MSGLVPVRGAARLGLATAAASRSVLAAAFAWVAFLAAVYASDAGPPLPAMAVTAAGLFPVAAWATAAHLAASSEDLRALLVAADGRVRALAVDLVPPALAVTLAAGAGVAAAALFDPRPAPAASFLLAAGLHLLCGAAGIGLAAVLHALRLARGTQLLVVVAAALASARLAWLPPAGPVLAAWMSEHPVSAGRTAWALTGPLLVTALLLAGTERLRCRSV